MFAFMGGIVYYSTYDIPELEKSEFELLSVNVNYFDARKDFILNYFQIKALEGSLIDLFENYLPDSN